jgi:hypothetical protein
MPERDRGEGRIRREARIVGPSDVRTPYEKERTHVAELEETERLQSEFIDVVAH